MTFLFAKPSNNDGWKHIKRNNSTEDQKLNSSFKIHHLKVYICFLNVVKLYLVSKIDEYYLTMKNIYPSVCSWILLCRKTFDQVFEERKKRKKIIRQLIISSANQFLEIERKKDVVRCTQSKLVVKFFFKYHTPFDREFQGGQEYLCPAFS
jgi:hypothetical protein